MSDDPGHNYSFGYPAGGWPMFGPTGKIVKDDHQAQSEEHAETCGVCLAQSR